MSITYLMIIKSICVLLVSIVVLNLQLRIVRTVFPHKEEKNKVLLYTLLMGAFVASALIIFTHLIAPNISTRLSSQNIGYSIYIWLLGIFITSIFAAKKHRWLVFIMSTLTILAWITGLTELLFAGAWLGVVILKATGEEVLKTSSWESLASHNTRTKNDIIVYSILAGLGFALFENIVYFISAGDVWQFVARSLTSSLLHGVFTGCIWFIIWRYSKLSYISYIIAYWLGISLHAVYNISLGSNPLLWWLVFTIGGYFLLGYLLYKSDSLYVKHHE